MSQIISTASPLLEGPQYFKAGLLTCIILHALRPSHPKDSGKIRASCTYSGGTVLDLHQLPYSR